MATCPACGASHGRKPIWVREVCPDCKADDRPTLADRLRRLEVEVEELKQRQTQ